MGDANLAMPSARAGRPTARAMLRCLGYSATIAIAGCSYAPDPNAEADESQYSVVAMTIQHDQPGAKIARRAMADGILTNGEYDAVIAAWDVQKQSMCLAAKRSIRAVALGRLAAGKSFDLDDACHDGNMRTEDDSVFAFPKDGGGWDYLIGSASAMSTGTAKTPQAVEGRSPASAVPQADAQPSTPSKEPQ